MNDKDLTVVSLHNNNNIFPDGMCFA